MLNELIQANEMVLMNFWYIEHNDASFGDDFDSKMNDSNLSNGFHTFGILNTTVQELER